MKRILLVACLFFSFSNTALAEEDSPHFFGSHKSFFQRVEPIEFVFYFEDLQILFEKIEDSAKHLFEKRPRFFFSLNNKPVRNMLFLNRVEGIHIEIDIIFKEGDK